MAKRLTSDERARIEAHRAAGDIVELIGRHRSTVYRELSRGGGPHGVYRAHRAQPVAAARVRRPRAAKLEADSGLARGVCGRLKRGWSPHSISADTEDNLNSMPRRLHRWRSAADIYTQLSRNHR